MLYSHPFFCLPLLLAPSTVPCRTVFAMPEDLEMCHTIWVSVSSPWVGHHALQLHSGFWCEPSRSSHGRCRKWHLISTSCILLSSSHSRSGSQTQSKAAKMSVRISLTLETSEMFLFLHMSFSLERAADVWAILERISGFDPLLSMIAPRYLKFSTASSLWPFILISHWKQFGLCVIAFVLSGPIFILYLVVVVSRRSTRTPASSSSSAFTTMSSAKRKLVISRPPTLTLPSWSSNTSHMIFSRQLSKRIGASRHHCRTPALVPFQTSLLCCHWTGLHSGPCHTDIQ